MKQPFTLVSTEGYAYGVNVAGVGEQKGTAKQCSVANRNKSAEFESMPSYLKQYNLVRMEMNSAESKSLYKAKIKLPYYCPGVALRTDGGRAVFSLKEGGGLHYLTSAEFIASGREWDDIVFVPRWELHILAGMKTPEQTAKRHRM